ncbi:AbrB/MazE/SpoVT family DNA-binding domain-containing protein [Halorubrum sp. DM2]|uniref:AbrB/MazE/SpoVT family DNA-binding domain-containing protein n=1 Tax=Halorubrum sp. DM2 TaxID=2527867 RepID=UPI0024B7DBEF|nr:AbrB/MazE/SpoVT family DNA-binding domain-containing protein [Halorubrum sp. DM2]
MEENTDPQSQDKEAVVVSEDGQTQIPKRIREKLGIKAPGRIIFCETESGDVVVEAVRSPSEMRGFAAEKEASTDKSATKLLHEFRERSQSNNLD